MQNNSVVERQFSLADDSFFLIAGLLANLVLILKGEITC